MTMRIDSDAGSMPLKSFGVSGVIYAPDARGLGLPPDLTEWTSSPAGGGRLRSHRIGMREGAIPVTILGESSDEVRDYAQRLRAVTRASVHPELVATLTTGEVYRLPFYRTGGGEDGLPYEEVLELDWEIEIRCPSPYWVADQPRQIGPVGISAETVGLLPDLARLQVSGSTALGSIDIENRGDVPSPATWIIRGPGGPVAIDVAGRGFVIDTVLEEDETITISRTGSVWTVADETGANRYSALGPAPKFPAIPPGRSVAAISMDGAGPTASIAGYFRVRRELVL